MTRAMSVQRTRVLFQAGTSGRGRRFAAHHAECVFVAAADRHAAETFFPSSVTVAELPFGIGALPDARRRQKLAVMLDGLLALFGG